MKGLAVLLPVYNAEQFLEECVVSVLRQSLSDFQFIILDDCSTDQSNQILQKFAEKDKRIKLLRNKVNKGIIPNRNTLICETNAEYVAFMDADDICEKNRLECQYNYLEKKKELIGVGSYYQLFGAVEKMVMPPVKYEDIRSAMFMENMLCNPAMMIRRHTFIKNNLFCDINYKGSADYDLWVRALRVGRIENIPKVLLKYRMHKNQESVVNSKRQKNAHLRIVMKQLKELNVNDLNENFIANLIWPQEVGKEELIKTGEYTKYLLDAIETADIELGVSIKRFIDIRFRSACKRNGRNGLLSYLKTSGISRMVKGKNFGLNFVLDCLSSTGGK